jgi:hypothetical protein
VVVVHTATASQRFGEPIVGERRSWAISKTVASIVVRSAGRYVVDIMPDLFERWQARTWFTVGRFGK